MIFSLSRNRIINDTDIMINGQRVARVACTKFLGFFIFFIFKYFWRA